MVTETLQASRFNGSLRAQPGPYRLQHRGRLRLAGVRSHSENRGKPSLCPFSEPVWLELYPENVPHAGGFPDAAAMDLTWRSPGLCR